MRYDPEAWIWDEPGDWNLWRRMRDAGAAITPRSRPGRRALQRGLERRGSRRRRARHARRGRAGPARDRRAGAAGGRIAFARGCRPLPRGRGKRGPARAAAGDGRRLAVLDTHFPRWLSGFRYHEAAELLERRPDTVFFSAARTGESWDRPGLPAERLRAARRRAGVTDAYLRVPQLRGQPARPQRPSGCRDLRRHPARLSGWRRYSPTAGSGCT